jgi:predicted dehydrogenase
VVAKHTVARAAPNDQIQVGFVGAGGRAGSLLRLFGSEDDVDIVAISDIDSRRLNEAALNLKERSGRAPAAYRDFRNVVQNKSIDVVVVGTPDHWHAIPTIMACQAGKDVYVEKPDGHNMLEGQRMVAAMRKHNRIVQLGTQARTNEHTTAAIEFVRSGKLGRVLVGKSWESARQGSLGYPPDGEPPEGVDYDMWLGPAPKRPFNPRRFHGSWRWFFDYGTGDLGNDGVHRIDVARWALSTAVEAETGKMMSALPRKISALGGKWYFDDIQEWPDTLQVNYEYQVDDEPGRILTYEMRIWTPYRYMGESEGVALYGDRGYIVIGNEHWHAHAPNGEVLAEGRGSNAGASHVRNFLDCVKTRQRPNADLETVGHPSSVMCHAGNVAWKTGKQLVLDPDTELFDDSDANELRSRLEYRKPWELPMV